MIAPRPVDCEILTHNRTPLVLKAEVKLSIPGISTKSSDSEASLKTLILEDTKATQPQLGHRSSPMDQLNMLHWRMRYHHTTKQASHYLSNFRWRVELKLQTKHYTHSSLPQRRSSILRQDQRSLCSSQTHYQYCSPSQQETPKTTPYII